MGKKATKEIYERLRAAEDCLDAFWDKADAIILPAIADLDGTAFKRFLIQHRPIYRTPKWIEPPQQKETKPEPGMGSKIDALTQQVSAFYLNPESSSSHTEPLPAAPKPKEKTRGTPAPGSTELTTNSGTPEKAIPNPRPRFEVDARSLNVFRVLFFNPATNTTPGEITWQGFLHAMASVGFSAQKLYGSVWHFQPCNLDAQRSIQFHEPHPSKKIRFLVARQHGRRLNRVYGWSGDMFVLEQKA